MKKKSLCTSGLFTTRIVLAVALCGVGISLGWLSFAATPPSGTLTDTSGPLTYTAGPFTQPNQSPVGLGQLDQGPRCDNNLFPCDSYALTVTVPAGYATMNPNAAVKVTMSWNDTGSGMSDYDLYVYRGAVTTLNGNMPADYQSASGANPEVSTISPLANDGAPHVYTIKIVPFMPTGETVNVRIELLPGSGTGGTPGFGGPDSTAPGKPRFQVFVPPVGTSAEAGNGEFNIGFNPQTGRIMTMNSGPIWRLTPGEVQTPALPECCNAFWEDKSSTVTDTGLDPILFTDQKSGRTFASNSTVGANAVYAFSDDDGDTYTPFAVAGPNGGADHQTIGTGPYPLVNGLPNPLITPLNQGEAVYSCSQDIVGPASCYRSDTLGSSYGNPTVAYTGQGAGVPGGTCGGLHGHIHVATDGTAWLPVKDCSGLQGGVFTTDMGTTWVTFQAPNAISQTNGADPSIAIDANNTVYYSYVNNEPVASGQPPEGHARVQVGHRNPDNTVTWTNNFDLGATHGIVNAAHIEAVGGSAGRAAIGFFGTDRSGDYQALSFPGKWYAFIATTYDGGVNWTTVNATPNDPVQSMTGIWQQGGGAQDRNLLDFNEITLDDKGRVLYGYSDGCVTPACIAGTAPNDFTGHMRVARQFGGKTILASYDNMTDTTVALAPKPACLSGTRDLAASHLTWKIPDNGGSDIVNYLIFRGLTAGSEVQIGQTGIAKNSFNDTTADPAVPHYFYKVKAVNTSATPVGGFSNEIDLVVAAVPPPQTPCSLPGLTLLSDPTNDELDMVPGHDVQSLSLGEPFAYAPGKIVFTLKMQSLTTVPPSTRWPVKFDVGATNYTVRMTNDPQDGATGTPIFQVGPSAGPFVAADPASKFTPDGTITIVVPRSAIGNPAVGATLMNFISRITAGATLTPDNMPDGLTPTGSYTVVGNSFCAPNTAPLAAFTAYAHGTTNPPMGDPPFTVDFDASASSDADPGDTIASYTFTFGDGSAPVTQSTPTIQHTYTTNGDFTATLKVTDSRGLVSSNTGLVNIEVELPVDRVASRKAHGGVAGSPFEVVLYDLSVHPDGASDIECRLPAAENDYTIVYTLGSQYTVSSPATSVTLDGASTYVASHAPGPGANQYTIHLAPGVPNGRAHLIAFDGLPVHNNNAGAPNGGNATLKNAVHSFKLLVGDTTNNAMTNGSDVSQVKAQSGQSATSANFRLDVNANGAINSSDVSTVKAQSGTQIMAPEPAPTQTAAARKGK
ncbi:MAG: PKD domain-containing protein [Chthoniobacterales bacterium]